jgi:predicted nucleotidyltransferase
MSTSESQRYLDRAYLDLQAARSNLQPPLSHLTDRERQALAAFVNRIRQRFDGLILSAVLFGSRARGEASADSDVDVLVVIDNEDYRVRKEIRYLAAEVWLEYGLFLSTRIWSRSHWRKLQKMQTLLYRNIQRDGIDLLSPG